MGSQQRRANVGSDDSKKQRQASPKDASKPASTQDHDLVRWFGPNVSERLKREWNEMAPETRAELIAEHEAIDWPEARQGSQFLAALASQAACTGTFLLHYRFSLVYAAFRQLGTATVEHQAAGNARIAVQQRFVFDLLEVGEMETLISYDVQRDPNDCDYFVVAEIGDIWREIGGWLAEQERRIAAQRTFLDHNQVPADSLLAGSGLIPTPTPAAEPVKLSNHEHTTSLLHQRGPRLDTERKLEDLRRIRTNNIHNGRVNIGWTEACRHAGIDTKTAIRYDPELRQRWDDSTY